MSSAGSTGYHRQPERSRDGADQVSMGAAPQQAWPFGNGVPGPTPL
jgi:hypothetical protein